MTESSVLVDLNSRPSRFLVLTDFRLSSSEKRPSSDGRLPKPNLNRGCVHRSKSMT